MAKFKIKTPSSFKKRFRVNKTNKANIKVKSHKIGKAHFNRRTSDTTRSKSGASYGYLVEVTQKKIVKMLKRKN